MRKQDVLNHYRLKLVERRRRAGMKTRVSEYAAIIELAEAVGLTANAIYRWPEELDFARQCMVEVVTDGAFKADITSAPPNANTKRNRERVRKAEAVREQLGL